MRKQKTRETDERRKGTKSSFRLVIKKKRRRHKRRRTKIQLMAERHYVDQVRHPASLSSLAGIATTDRSIELHDWLSLCLVRMELKLQELKWKIITLSWHVMTQMEKKFVTCGRMVLLLSFYATNQMEIWAQRFMVVEALTSQGWLRFSPVTKWKFDLIESLHKACVTFCGLFSVKRNGDENPQWGLWELRFQHLKP